MRRKVYRNFMLPPSRVQDREGKRQPLSFPPSLPGRGGGGGGGGEVLDAVPAQGVELAEQLGWREGGREGGRGR